VSTLFLHVPYGDWLRVKYGEKTEFRALDTRHTMAASAQMPTPVVAYTTWRPYQTAPHQYDGALMVLEEHRVEPLFLVGDEPGALAREGFPSYQHFRSYWEARHGVFRPTEHVHVWRLRCWQDSDEAAMGRLLLDRLYGQFRNGDLEPDEFPG
jgi:hypothetical protein